ncbi:hypothetical protein TNCV_130401 [Trichonephila clavipes]|nr:hypothetical protein TNCV_130401 [Trichonephila clavipes]
MMLRSEELEWNQVVFNNESIFNLDSDNNRVHVWSPVVKVSILPSLYSGSPPPQLVGCPIDRIWDYLGRIGRIRGAFAATEEREMSQGIIRHKYASMPNRMTCIQARRDPSSRVLKP